MPRTILKNKDAPERFSCRKCGSLLEDAVQVCCGHRLCKSCADELIASEPTPKCPECRDDIDEEEGLKVNDHGSTTSRVVTMLQLACYIIIFFK